MNTELFIRRPVTTTLVMLAILLFGVVAYRALPVNDLPNVDFPTISVGAGLPGANPDTMASAVAMPLERQFSTIAGLDSMTSTSAMGSTNITLQFTLDRNIDAAAQDVQAMIAKAQRDLPRDMPSPPSYQKVNPADQPILYISMNSPTLPLSDVDEFAQTVVAQRVSMISGVAQVSVYGSQKYAVRAQLDPRKLAARQVGIDEVTTAIQRGNVNLPTGTLWGQNQAQTIMASGQLYRANEYRPLIVAYRNGNPIRLEELGRIIDSVEADKNASWYNTKTTEARSITLAIQRQPGTNTVQVVDNIMALLPTLKQQMPASVNLNIVYDRSASIRESIHDVEFTLLLTIALVVMVIFLFLRNISATIIPSMALPMSLVGTFAIMYLMGYSLNNLSLMALTLSVGFVVDDAIVMLENIVRHMEKGESAFQAALRGSREIGFTIISMTLSLAAVFIPVLFLGGILGRLLHEFAVTIGAAILISGFVSLTLTPMLCSRFLRPPKEAHHGRFYAVSEKFFAGMQNFYRVTLAAVLRHKLATMASSVLVLVGTAYLFVTIPKGFLPTEDIGMLWASTEAAQGVSFEEMVRHQRAAGEILRRSPYVETFSSAAGGMGGATNTGRFFLKLKPRDQRPDADTVVRELRAQLSQIPGIQVYLQVPQPISFGGRMSKSQYQYTLQSPDTAELYQNAPKLEAELAKASLLQDVTSDLQMKNPQVTVDIDRDKAAALGVSVQQVEDALYTSYGSRQVSTIYAPNNAYRVIVELLPEFQRDADAMRMLYIRSASGQLVPLSTVAHITPTLGPLTVNHQGQLPAVTISFNLKPGAALGTALQQVEQASKQVLPDTISTSFQGTAQAFNSSMRGLNVLLLMAVLVIYIILGILYESFIHPLTILSGLIPAGFGALVALALFGMDLNLYAFVGVIMLVGIVKKNAIMMIDFALDAQREQGRAPEEAIYEGALVRFRPIMMTTMAALMGTLPIALGYGAGAESRRPLGIAVVGGLLFSQVMTLYITPVLYTYMEKVQQRLRRGRRKRPVVSLEGEPAVVAHD